MNTKFTLGLVVVVLIGIGYFLYTNYYAPKIVSESSEVVLACSDTGGFDIYVKGHVGYERDEPGQSSYYNFPDTCEIHPIEGTVLREGWCDGLVVKNVRTTCGFGFSCSNGACVKN